MADLITDVIGRWRKSGPLISPRQIRIWARGVASRNLQLATLLSQPSDMTAEKLVGQYYRMRGLCAETGIPLLHSTESKPLAIELDHIVPVNRRKSLEAAFSGSAQKDGAGLAASMDNVRLVCRFAHRVRHQAELQGLDFTSFCSMWSHVSTEGCIIDPTIGVNHQSSCAVRQKADTLIGELISDQQRFYSFDAVCALLEKNHLPLSCQDVRKLMLKNLGIGLKAYATNFRINLIRSLLAGDSHLSARLATQGCTSEILEAINNCFITAGMSPMTRAGISPYFRRLGITLPGSATKTGKPRQRYVVNSSSRLSLWAFSKAKSAGGFSELDVRQQFPGWDQALISLAISDAVSRNLIEEKHGRLFGRVNRSEAARILHLSPQVLKKYAVMGKAPPHLLGKPGIGVEATYSIDDLLNWRRLHPERSRLTKHSQGLLSGF
jgi:hypothetical protein